MRLILSCAVYSSFPLVRLERNSHSISGDLVSSDARNSAEGGQGIVGKLSYVCWTCLLKIIAASYTLLTSVEAASNAASTASPGCINDE